MKTPKKAEHRSNEMSALTKEQIIQINTDKIVQKKIDELRPFIKNLDLAKLAKL